MEETQTAATLDLSSATPPTSPEFATTSKLTATATAFNPNHQDRQNGSIRSQRGSKGRGRSSNPFGLTPDQIGRRVKTEGKTGNSATGEQTDAAIPSEGNATQGRERGAKVGTSYFATNVIQIELSIVLG